jgi:hypothetical protein
MILEMRSFTTFGFSKRLDGFRPSPPGFKDGAADHCAADFNEFQSTLGEDPNLIGLLEILHFRLFHDCLRSFSLIWATLPLDAVLAKQPSFAVHEPSEPWFSIEEHQTLKSAEAGRLALAFFARPTLASMGFTESLSSAV